MSEGYTNTISGLLRKRAEMLGELSGLRDRTARVTNDVRSIDRILVALGHQEELPRVAERAPRTVLFVRNELRKFILDELRKATEPISSRELAIRMAAAEGRDPNDRGLMTEIMRRVSRSVGILLGKGVIRRARDEAGRYIYELKRQRTPTK